MLKPLKNCFLFAFFNDTAQGRFIDRTAWGFQLTSNNHHDQGKYARWGKVLVTGPQVKGFKSGDIVLIEVGMWTTGFDYDDVRIWKSDESKVIALGDDETVTFQY